MSRGKARRSLELIEASIEILRAIQPASVRAVCYQLFTRGLIDSMAKNETNRVGRQLTDAREAGAIPWAWIVDETRAVEAPPTWADPEGFATAVTRSYRRNKWQAQPARVEVWSEKGTVRGTLAPVLDRYEVPFRVMHGFASATSVHDVARESLASPQPFVVLYVGDWDPSGLYMSEEDLPARLIKYRAQEFRARDDVDEAQFIATSVRIVRLALTEVDIADASLPSFEADTKRGDPRWGWFVAQYGAQCWELDALSPVTLRERVEAAIHARLDLPAWTRYVKAEALERASITESVRTWRSLTATTEVVPPC